MIISDEIVMEKRQTLTEGLFRTRAVDGETGLVVVANQRWTLQYLLTSADRWSNRAEMRAQLDGEAVQKILSKEDTKLKKVVGCRLTNGSQTRPQSMSHF